MSYPRNAASPPIVAVGAIYLIADGTIQTSGASVRVKTGSGAWATGAGALACDTDSGIWTYVPTQGETNAESFIVAIYKSACTSQHQTVATSASATAGYAGVDWGKIADKTATVALTNTTINAAPIADAVLDELISQHLTSGSLGWAINQIRKANQTIEGTVLASPTPTTTVFSVSGINYPTGAFKHAVLLFADDASIAEQNSPILTYTNNGDGTSTITVEEAFTAAPATGDKILIIPTTHVHAVAAIQGEIPDRLGYLLSILAGAISDAGTAAETYTITLGANTFTVDYSGLDAAGNRTGATLTKT
jgi:hypothetical protein